MLGAYIAYFLYGEAYDLALYILQNNKIEDNNNNHLNELIKILKSK